MGHRLPFVLCVGILDVYHMHADIVCCSSIRRWTWCGCSPVTLIHVVALCLRDYWRAFFCVWLRCHLADMMDFGRSLFFWARPRVTTEHGGKSRPQLACHHQATEYIGTEYNGLKSLIEPLRQGQQALRRVVNLNFESDIHVLSVWSGLTKVNKCKWWLRLYHTKLMGESNYGMLLEKSEAHNIGCKYLAACIWYTTSSNIKTPERVI